MRWLGYVWALPVSLIGALFALLARLSGGLYRVERGVLEVSGGWPAKLLCRGFPFCGPAAAITLGHVVLGATQDALEKTRSHERVHVRQYERWGILFVLAYPLAGVWAWLKGGNPYWDNAFERQARELESQ